MNKTPNQTMASVALATLQAAIEKHGDFPLPIIEYDGEEHNFGELDRGGVLDMRKFELVLRPSMLPPGEYTDFIAIRDRMAHCVAQPLQVDTTRKPEEQS